MNNNKHAKKVLYYTFYKYNFLQITNNYIFIHIYKSYSNINFFLKLLVYHHHPTPHTTPKSDFRHDVDDGFGWFT